MQCLVQGSTKSTNQQMSMDKNDARIDGNSAGQQNILLIQSVNQSPNQSYGNVRESLNGKSTDQHSQSDSPWYPTLTQLQQHLPTSTSSSSPSKKMQHDIEREF